MDTYTVQKTCWNCEKVIGITRPKGEPVGYGWQSTECGCTRAHKDIADLMDRNVLQRYS